MAPDRMIDRAMVHAGAAADAAQHMLEIRADHRRAAVVEQHDVIFLGTVDIARTARAGGQRRVDAHLLARGGAREHAQELRHVFERRRDLFQRRHHDVALRQDLRQIAIALVGDDDRRAGFRDEKIRAGDADVGRQKLFTQNAARFRQQLRRLGQIAVLGQMRVNAPEIALDLILGQMHGRADDVRGNLATQLDDIFAEIGLDRRDAGLLHGVVERDLLRDHALALGDGLCAALGAYVENDIARLFGRAREMHMSARRRHLLLVGLEIEVEMGERMVLDVARAVAQRLEFRQLGNGDLPSGREADAQLAHGFLQLRIVQRLVRIVLEMRRGRIGVDAHLSASGAW